MGDGGAGQVCPHVDNLQVLGKQLIGIVLI